MIKRIGKVIDNIDEKKKGRVQVQIIPEFLELNDADLPWAIPKNNFLLGANITERMLYKVPHIDTYVEVEISDDWTSFCYTEYAPYIDSIYKYDELYAQISDIIENIGENEYPQPMIQKTPDGTIDFHNTKTGERGIIFSTGSYIHILDTKLFLYGSDGLQLKIDTETNTISILGSNSSVSFDMENNEINFLDIEKVNIGGSSDILTLFTPLKQMLEKLLDHNHVAPSGPTTPAQEVSGIPLSAQKSKLNDLKSIVNSD